MKVLLKLINYSVELSDFIGGDCVLISVCSLWEESGLVFQWGTGMASRAKRAHQGKSLPLFWTAKEPCEIRGNPGV